MSTKKTTLKERFGAIPNESGLKRKMRLHQGWWRTNVLSQEAGFHPKKENERICNTILDGEESKNNYLTKNSYIAVQQTLNERSEQDSGLMEQDRLFNNLLSSQPLCFNFFGELKADLEFGLSVLRHFYPNLTKLRKVIFEFAPIEKYTKDNSAFDIAFEVEENDKIGLIGWECKYTDSFSSTVYDKPSYKAIFSKSISFVASYDLLKASKTNQLFRNQLIAEGLIQNKKYTFVYTGLFCFQDDFSAIETGKFFQSLLNDKTTDFKIVTYSDFIRSIQQLDIEWNKREWSMLLWARYCATVLSESTTKQLENEL